MLKIARNNVALFSQMYTQECDLTNFSHMKTKRHHFLMRDYQNSHLRQAKSKFRIIKCTEE